MKYSDQLSGKGAAIAGARWNSKGTEIIYTATNRSLAMAEVAVGLHIAATKIQFCLKTIYLPSDCSMQTVNMGELPLDWNAIPANESTKSIGDQFTRNNEYLALRVPSVVTKGDWNLLINPNHPEFHKVKVIEVDAFPFDRRLFK